MNSCEDIFNQTGDTIDIGCSDNNIPKSINYAYSVSGNKRVRVVKDWQWWDLIFDERTHEAFTNEGLQPSIVYCKNLIFDSDLFVTNSGVHVRTSLLKKFHKDYSVYETNNTHYILNGPGERKSVNAELVFNI